VIAERRRKALKEVIEENHRLHDVLVALEEENMSCKKLIEESTELVNTLKVKYFYYYLWYVCFFLTILVYMLSVQH